MRGNSSANRRPEPRKSGSGESDYFRSSSRDEALARLQYVVEQRRACGLLIGPAGTGKSVLCRALARSLRAASRCNVAMLDLRGSSSDELPLALSDVWNLGPVAGSTDRIWAEVLDHVRGVTLCRAHAVLIVDHLDQVVDGTRTFDRLSFLADRSAGALTVLYTARELDDCAALAQVAELSDLRIEVLPFDALETSRYVSHRLLADGRPTAPLDPEALLSIYRRTGGVARELNRVCELLLLAGVNKAKTPVSSQLIDDLAAELAPALVSAASLV